MKLPELGLGTWDLRGKECTETVLMALELGYKHIDTAHSYENHEAIAKALLSVRRESLFLTSKLALDQEVDLHRVEASVEKACARALKELGTEYLDLYLIHWPTTDFPLEAVFASMVGLQEKGWVKEVGVSNYTIHHLEDLKRAGFIPFANRVEFHPYLYQKDLLEWCQQEGVQLISFRSFGKGGLLKEEPLLTAIGKHHGKTAAQVVLRWLVQKGVASVPKSVSKKHLQENLEIFDFTLTEGEVAKLDGLNQGKRYCQPDNPVYKY